MIRLPMLAVLFLASWACAGEPDYIDAVLRRFQPLKPALTAGYDATYVLLNIRLKCVANATIQAAEGLWCGTNSASPVPACLIDFTLASPDQAKALKRGGLRLLKRTVCVATLPDLKLLAYAKRNDEAIRPWFASRPNRMDYVEYYDFEAAPLLYRRHDLMTGAVETDIPGLPDLAHQSDEMGAVLRSLYGAFHERPGPLPEGGRIHFNVDGAVRSFSLKTAKRRTYVPYLKTDCAALFADITPSDGGQDRRESFSMWCVPFREFARTTDDGALRALADSSLEWSMLPLSGEYSLFLGSIECILTHIGTRASPPGSSGTSSPASPGH